VAATAKIPDAAMRQRGGWAGKYYALPGGSPPALLRCL